VGGVLPDVWLLAISIKCRSCWLPTTLRVLRLGRAVCRPKRLPGAHAFRPLTSSERRAAGCS
jgi:hypothetical protein